AHELGRLVSEGLPYEIVPGVTAASGAAAYAGIPLTARDYASSVRFMTCYSQAMIEDIDWHELAKTKDTLVFYMSAEKILEIVDRLIESCASPEIHVAVIEQASTPNQKVYRANLFDFRAKLGNTTFNTPSIFIVGRVVALHEQFCWQENNNKPGDYFSPLNAKPELIARA
ncbi:MAG TPA: SAM-dependent methyltransferase, partial [Puia sp.]|nr:SAM-dependent methyltransferase [Puia sp.]